MNLPLPSKKWERKNLCIVHPDWVVGPPGTFHYFVNFSPKIETWLMPQPIYTGLVSVNLHPEWSLNVPVGVFNLIHVDNSTDFSSRSMISLPGMKKSWKMLKSWRLKKTSRLVKSLTIRQHILARHNCTEKLTWWKLIITHPISFSFFLPSDSYT